MNKILLIIIVLLISCYLILNIKEGFTATTSTPTTRAPTTGTIGTKYFKFVDELINLILLL